MLRYVALLAIIGCTHTLGPSHPPPPISGDWVVVAGVELRVVVEPQKAYDAGLGAKGGGHIIQHEWYQACTRIEARRRATPAAIETVGEAGCDEGASRSADELARRIERRRAGTEVRASPDGHVVAVRDPGAGWRYVRINPETAPSPASLLSVYREGTEPDFARLARFEANTEHGEIGIALFEAELSHDPRIARAVAVPVPSEASPLYGAGEPVVAFVALAPHAQATSEDIRQFVADVFDNPTAMIVIDPSVPANADDTARYQLMQRALGELLDRTSELGRQYHHPVAQRCTDDAESLPFEMTLAGCIAQCTPLADVSPSGSPCPAPRLRCTDRCEVTHPGVDP